MQPAVIFMISPAYAFSHTSTASVCDAEREWVTTKPVFCIGKANCSEEAKWVWRKSRTLFMTRFLTLAKEDDSYSPSQSEHRSLYAESTRAASTRHDGWLGGSINRPLSHVRTHTSARAMKRSTTLLFLRTVQPAPGPRLPSLFSLGSCR